MEKESRKWEKRELPNLGEERKTRQKRAMDIEKGERAVGREVRRKGEGR